MKRKTWLVFVVILILVARCSKTQQPKLAPHDVEPIIWETSSILSTKDWTECSAPSCWQHAILVMDGLFKLIFKNGDWQLQNSLAENYQWKDSLLTIEIRGGVRWSDGRELASEDFIESWKLSLRKCATLRQFSALQQVRGLNSYCASKAPWKQVGIQAAGPRTLTIETQGPDVGILKALAHPMFFPRSGSKKEIPATLGPYLLTHEHSTPPKTLVYVPNPGYFRTSQPLSRLIVREHATAQESTVAFQANQIQLAGPYPGNTPPPTGAIGSNQWALPTSMRVGAMHASLGAPLRPMGLDWDEVQRLAFPNFFSCRDNRLCTASTIHKSKTQSVGSVWISTTENTPVLTQAATNLGMQWQARYDTKAHYVPFSKLPLPKASKPDRMQPPKPAGNALVLFHYRQDPFEGLSPTEALVRSCVALFPAEEAKGRATRVDATSSPEITVRLLEAQWIRPEICIPLLVESEIYLRSPRLIGMEWSALGVLDFSAAQMAPMR